MLILVALTMALHAVIGFNSSASSPTVVFRPMHRFFTSQNKWILGFSVEMTPYTNILDQLDERVDNLIRLANSLETTYDKLNVHFTDSNDKDSDAQAVWFEDYSKLANSQKPTCVSLKNELNVLRSKLNQHQLLFSTMNRPKRSLIPFLGSILKKLIGTADEASINDIRRRIYDLSQSTEQITHIIDDSL